jgi:excinuclease ABC subunit A
MYILDEPSIGLHPKDTERLIKVLLSLRDLGNTVIVVEHDEDIMKAADMIIDIGPEAGTHGGELVAQGTYEEILKFDSLTAKYLNGQ